MKIFNRTFIMLALVVTVGALLVGCGSFTSNGGWATKMNSSTTYNFAYTKASYGNYYLSGSTATQVSEALPNVNNLTITKSWSNDKVAYAISGIQVFEGQDVRGIKQITEGDNSPYYYLIKYTDNEGNPQVKAVNTNLSRLTMYYDKTVSNIAATRFVLTDTLNNVDITKNLTVEFTYNTWTKTDQAFKFTFELAKAAV